MIGIRTNPDIMGYDIIGEYYITEQIRIIDLIEQGALKRAIDDKVEIVKRRVRVRNFAKNLEKTA